YNPKLADVWSLGIILFIMLNASMPFDDTNLRKLLKDQLNRNWSFRSHVRDSVSNMAKGIVRHLLEPDITQRLTLERAMALDWVRSRREKPPSAAKLTTPAAAHASSPSLPPPPPARPLATGTSVPSGASKSSDPAKNSERPDQPETHSASKHRKSAVSKSAGATPVNQPAE
ncbi:testis-specific serine/threonine-protein kinase 1-like, partial [Frankliniella occidentalis]|uniref:Testis-specific serine/threonine-protein kinase 1-like n=1 Tax=Frankliniella occidentalis TaxID=133901 RepID=A0A9C6XB85_FRAOC